MRALLATAVTTVTLLQLAATAITVAAAAAAANIALPGCPSKCGELEIPCPFGTTPGCYRPGFMVTCNPKAGAGGVPQLAKLGGRHGPAVLDISVANSTVRVRSQVWFFDVGNTTTTRLRVVPDAGPFVVHPARNRIAHIGCGFRVSSFFSDDGDGTTTPFNVCNASCSKGDHGIRSGRCRGIGCCNATIPRRLTSFRTQFQWTRGGGRGEKENHQTAGCPSTTSLPPPPWCITSSESNAAVVVVEKSWWHDTANVYMLMMSLLGFGKESVFLAPAILDWSFDNSSTCAEAAKTPSFGCVSKHSECVDNDNDDGHLVYVCKCGDGYQGNPYVTDGCQRSRPPLHIPAGIIFAMGVGIGICLLLLILATIFLTKSLKNKKAKKMREYFFKKNRGLLLQQLVLNNDIAERMIFSLDELEKATNRFDKSRILGGGGHGTVYKGILSNQYVVAIKISKVIIQREINGFINEVAILSQLNHRNVVKLFGCCLETEVPLLVYEFIPNGTLYAHLHVDSPTSLPWKDRLRIAFEVASSLAYLHSEASMSIVHRDIKTSNVLLDDHLTAKVSDFGASRGLAIDKSGVTTAIQGTYGYLDPEYCYTRRLTEKSDVYSYGVMIVELMTRKKPTIDMPLDCVSLVEHFIQLFSDDRLSDILDLQVNEEGEQEVKQMAAIAVLCLQMKGVDRPTMRQVKMRLQEIQFPNNNFHDNPGVQGQQIGDNNNSSCRRFSMEREILSSTTLPR